MFMSLLLFAPRALCNPDSPFEAERQRRSVAPDPVPKNYEVRTSSRGW
jgi:hypothetical protein